MQINDVTSSNQSSSSTSAGSSSNSLSYDRLTSSTKCGLLSMNNKHFSVEFTPKFSVSSLVSKKKMKKKKSKQQKEKEESKPKPEPDYVTICISGSRYSVLGDVAKELGWKMVRENEPWNICWTDASLSVEICKDMKRFQKINHFPGMFEICRKDLLARNMNRMLKLFPKDYQIFPKTWHFPADLGDAKKYAKCHRNRMYILKPDQGAQGRGISLTKSLKDIDPTEKMICQLYISKPLLIDGFKFDLRVYALITSIDPLRVYVYNEGLARFATSAYRVPNGVNSTNMYMHLTNYSVNRHSRMFSKDDECGSKRSFSTLNKILSSEGYDVVTLWNNIDDVVIKTIMSAYPVMKHNYKASFPSHDKIQACFELLGIDIIIDEDMKPWLLEVNHSPSFHTHEQVDKQIKVPLIRDTFVILNIQNNDKKKVLNEDKRRVNNRLLRRLKEIKKRSAGVSGRITSSLGSIDENSEIFSKQSDTMRTNAWINQVIWEENNMGGYRRIIPVPGDDAEKYAKLFNEQNTCSVYSDTVTSKKREEAAATLRLAIAEKAQLPVFYSSNGKNLIGKFILHDDNAQKKKPKRTTYKGRLSKGFLMQRISDTDERERLTVYAQRDFLVKSCGVIQSIFDGFKINKLLSSNDLKIYGHLNERGNDNLELKEQKVHLRSIEKI